MQEQLKSRIELFVSNTQALQGKFIFQSLLLKRLAALLYAAENKVVDLDAIRESHVLIKENTSLFSTFRGNSAMSIATLLSLRNDRPKLITDTLNAYDLMKEYKFCASDYLVVAAYMIAASTSVVNHAQAIDRAKAFYDGMKADHYFLTGANDYIFAALLGLSNLEINSGLARMEQLYQTLKPSFHSGNGVQALTQVLVLGGDQKDIEAHVLDLCDQFRRSGVRLDREYTLSSLGVLSLLPVEIRSLVSYVVEAYDFLRTQKGFGSWSLSKQELLLFASSLVALSYVDGAQSDLLTTTLSTSLTSIIIAQQTAVAVATASSAAAASSSSS
jgi:hypothetical protein